MLKSLGFFRPRSKSITDNTDATDFIFSRISFTLGFVTDFIAPNGAGLPQAKGKSVKIQCANGAHNPNASNKNP